MDAERLLRHLGDVAGMPGLFFEAAETERKLPGVVKKRYSVAWPDYVPDPGLAYGYGEFEVRMPPADAAEIFRYDCALELARSARACVVSGGENYGVTPGDGEAGLREVNGAVLVSSKTP